jgi:hypothetical protein
MTTDALTKQQFEPSRSNQRFQYPENRIRFHNLKAQAIRKEKRFIDKPLSQNYKILTDIMNGKKEGAFHRQFLLGKGFDFNVKTHYEFYNEKNWNAIYNYIIVPCTNDIIKIILKKQA